VPRALDLGIRIGTLAPGPRDAITDVAGVRVGSVTLIAAELARGGSGEAGALPVVGETWDGVLNDVNGFHVRPEHVDEALARASDVVEEGCVGGGTGMICHGFKGGIGTASRVVDSESGGFTVGVLVQANHGRRERLCVGGLPVGRLIGSDVVPPPGAGTAGAGSIIVSCATDAPLLPHQCTRLAQRCALGIARTGGAGENSSGDLLLAFSTANRSLPPIELEESEAVSVGVDMLVDAHIDALFHAAIEATEAAIVAALLAAETMTGRDGITAHALGAERLLEALRRLDPEKLTLD